ncbi:MAG TPA: radical SAM protein [Acidobacteriaceae bacterium]
MATIAAQIDNHDVRVADMAIWRMKAIPRFLQVLRDFKPDVVGFTSMTFQYETTVGFAHLAKQFDPHIRTVLGGYHATLFAETIASSPDAPIWDFLIRGEGDFAFGELLDNLEAGAGSLQTIPGLSYNQDGVFHHNGPRPLEDITRIRIPARDKRLDKGFHMYFRRADVIETSRGCLHMCNFCSIREMYGRSFRLFPIERVLADIEDAYSRGARHIFCTDDNITLDMDRFEQLCDGVIGLKLKNLMFTTQASPIGFAHRPDLARKMVQAGFVSIFLGIENASLKNLRTMNKPNTLDTIQRGVAALQKEGIIVIAGIINGLPDDDPESIRENYQFVKNMGITSVMDQIMTPYPKTPLRGDMITAGRVANLFDFRWYDGYFSNVRTSHLEPHELNFVRWKIRRDVIGMWRATKGDWKFFKAYTYLWEFGFRHIVWFNEKLLELIFGVEGRYKLQMRQYMQLNDFGIEIPGRQHIETYHPVYGTAADPFHDTRWSLLKNRLPFPWRKRLAPALAPEPIAKGR